ncbi:hypothetical protein [Polyangium sp. y55x31]|uniref:hypothetical protein n=1 Tax=Polyangium sp. y55x31 TaxID=3042688 RepID=UPI0024826004|nr:hypothetical protein [Polyangium sp. y55x31]MDI1483613.1 hypothetical protein [Polyangium sp. y55x31]
MTIRKHTSFILAALVLLPLGCSATGSRSRLEPIISDKARPLSDEEVRTALVFEDRLEFPLESESWLDEVTPGDILVSDHDAGFLRLVESIESKTDAIVVYTADAALTDIVEQGETETTVEFADLEPTSAHGFPGLSPQAAGDLLSFDENLTGEVIDLGDGVTARITNGFVSFKPSFDIKLAIQDWKPVEFRAIANGAFSSNLQMEIEGAWALNTTREKTIWKSSAFRVPLPPIGGVPITCTASLTLKAGFTLDAAGQMHVTLGQTFDFDGSMGVRYERGSGWEKVRSFNPNWTPEVPQMGADVQVQATGYLVGALNVGFYGLTKWSGTGGELELSAKPSLRLSYASSEPAPGWGLYGGLQVDATPSLKVLHASLASTTLNLYKDERLLLPAAGSNDAAPIDTGNCADGQEDGLETAVDCGGTCAACNMGDGCVTDDDCASGACVSGECTSASCDNGVQDADETGVDCGGSCPECSGGACQDAADCVGANCVDGVCEAPLNCFDNVQNGAETDVDCGGPCDPCYGDSPWNCYDGELSGDEEDVDCGGSCPSCDGGGGGGGGGSCDGTGDCNKCATCADQGACSALLDTCLANPDCVGLSDCLSPCSDQTCVDDCYSTYPGGDSDLFAYQSCLICSECYDDCGGAGQCQ